MAEPIEEIREDRRSSPTTLELQLDVLGELDTVAAQLDQAVADLRPEPEPRVGEPLRVEERLAASRRFLYDRVLSRLGDDTRSAADLPLLAALLHVAPSIGRMGDQCQLLGRLTPQLSQRLSPYDDGRVQLSLMGQLAHSQLLGAKKAFLNRDMNQVDRLVRRDSDIKRAGGKVFDRAIGSSHHKDVRRSAVMLLIASRCLEGITDEAMEIGEQAAFVSAGLFKELDDSVAYG